jgi:hypothetical protein
LKAISVKTDRYKLFDKDKIENERREAILNLIADKIGEEGKTDAKLQDQIQTNFNKLVEKAIHI